MLAFLRRIEVFFGLLPSAPTVLIAGKCGAGKTTLARILAGEGFVHDRIPTKSVTHSRVVRSQGRLRLNAALIDPPGEDANERDWHAALADASVVVFVIDSTDKDEFEHAVRGLQRLFYLTSLPILVLLNKIDQTNYADAFKPAVAQYGTVVCVSMETGENMDAVERFLLYY